MQNHCEQLSCKHMCRCMAIRHAAVCVCLCTLLKPGYHFQQVMRLPCDVQHVVFRSGLLNSTQSLRQTRRCAHLGAHLREGVLLVYAAVEPHSSSSDLLQCMLVKCNPTVEW
ncbi:hypothetical protein AMECASPLE_033718 [Ameca splendens]|uniref:Uncharacterized protein n=1 Tax=Ameca splendens TaxID=208324 RepID=A0ABV0ZRS1_9TELE